MMIGFITVDDIDRTIRWNPEIKNQIKLINKDLGSASNEKKDTRKAALLNWVPIGVFSR